MKKLFTLLVLLVAIVTGAQAADVITFAGATTKDSKTTALTPTISSTNANITLGTCASTCSTNGYIITTTDGKTTILGNTTYYLSQPYQSGSKKYWKDAGANFYGTFTIPSGYTYVIKGVNHALAAQGSSNFTATISIKDATSTKYATSEISVTKLSSDGGTITSTAIALAEADWVTLSAGTYTINVTPANTKDSSTGKYFGIAEVSITGDLVAEGPAITTQPQSAAYASGQTMDPLTVVATASAGDLEYQWYSCDDAEKTNAVAIDGATSASYTPTEAGFYYVKVTDGNGPVESSVAEITVSAAEAPHISVSGAPAEAVKVGAEVVLTAEATGTPTPTITWYDSNNQSVATIEGTQLPYTVPTNKAGTYTFYAKASNGVEPDATSANQTIVVKEQVATPTISPNGAYFEESQDVELESATEDATILYSTDNGETWNTYNDELTLTETKTIKVKATKDGMIDSEEATATFNKVTLVEQTSISEATTWDFSKYGTKEIGTNGTPFYRNDVLVANVAQYGKAAAAADFGPATALVLNGDYIVRDTKFCQVTHAKFKTTVPGTLKVVFSNTGSDTRPYRYLYVNGVKTEYASNTSKSNTTAEGIQVNSGEVDLYGVLDPEADNADAGQVTFIRIYSIEFTPLSAETLILGEQGGNADKISAAAGTTKNVFVDRKISNEYYNTLFLPFALTTAQINTIFGEGTKVAKYKGLKSNGTTFLFENVTTDMEANVGYLVKPANTVNGFSVEGAAIVNAGNISVTDFAMLGTYDTFGNKAGNIVYYFTTEGKMKKLSDTGKIKGLRAMLAKIQNGAKTVSTIVSNVDLNPVIEGGTGGSRAREEYFVEFVDDASVVTAIEAIDNSQLTIDNDAPAYNLAGQKVGKGYKGIVIKNGKKVVMK